VIAGAGGLAGELSDHEALDLVIVNAGVNTNIGPDGAGERWPDVEELHRSERPRGHGHRRCGLPAMRARGQGQIALISSLAAYYGLPVTPSYCASKAAIKTYGEAMRGWLASEGVRVSVIMPGYVESRMCREMPGPKPFLWSPERAGRTSGAVWRATRRASAFRSPQPRDLVAVGPAAGALRTDSAPGSLTVADSVLVWRWSGGARWRGLCLLASNGC
jgi:NAD(P)-dependent dehydrogenase (short-subunit alcohol dehydrogenase family)